MQLLQETLFPAAGRPEELYLRINHPPFMRRVAVVEERAQRPAICLNAGDVLSTDTFFGSFYRGYWHEFAPLGRLAVKLDFRGMGRLRIFEDTGRGVGLLADYEIRSTGSTPILAEFLPVDLDADPEAASRLFVEIEAERESHVRAVEFVSPDTEPKREVRLSVGLCTFNQEAYFADTLSGLARLAVREPALGTVHVVNQGAPFQSERINEILRDPAFHLVEQRNLGGCGGFTRSLIEEQAADDPATHHLMMDDDIVLDERLISRAIRFLSFTTKDIALGGAMFDGMRPRIMYEAGAFLTPDNVIEPYCHNVDLADPGQLHHFNKVVETDYNAWWFCILPVARVRPLGLPAPIFIRGDDFEFGQRLARDGVPTVTLPGVAVWHEPFYAKPGGWQGYYDLRNRLIFAATYDDKVRQLSLFSILGLLASPCLEHDYMTAELRLKAVADFLCGPDELFARDPEALHRDVMALARANAPEKLNNAAWKGRPLAPARARPEGARALALGALRALLATGLMPRRRGEPVLLDADAHPANTSRRAYVKTNGVRSYHQRFAPRRARLWALMWRVLRLALRYRREVGPVSVQWAQGIGSYRQPESWAKILDRPEETNKRPGAGVASVNKAAE